MSYNKFAHLSRQNQAFIKYANQLTVGREAAFVVALVNSDAAEDLLKHFKKTFESEDDLELAYNIFELYNRNLQEGLGYDVNIQNSVRDIFLEAQDIMASGKVFVNHIYAVGDNFERIDNHQCRNRYWIEGYIFENRITVNNKIMRISALAEAFCKTFAPENLLYFMEIKGKSKCFSIKHGLEVTVSKKSAAHPFGKHMRNCGVAYQLQKTEGGKMMAKFVCGGSNAYLKCIHRFAGIFPPEKLFKFKLCVGTVLGMALAKKPWDFFKNIESIEEFGLIRGYNNKSGQLSIICSQRALGLFQTHIRRMGNEMIDEEARQTTYYYRMEDRKATLVIGPGLSIQDIVPDSSDGLPTIPCTIRVPLSDSSQVNDFLDCLNEFDLNKFMNCDPHKMFTFNGFLYALFKKPADAKKFKQQYGHHTQFEYVPGGFLDYLLSQDFHVSESQDKPGRPKTDCIICLGKPSKSKWLRLSYCGHVYCDGCFQKLLENTDEFPIKCSKCREIPRAGAVHPQQIVSQTQIGICDFRTVLSRNFSNAASLQDFIMPILSRSLDQFMLNTDKFFQCKKTGCGKRLLSASAVPSVITCPDCKAERCGQCGDGPHKGISCSDNFIKTLEASPEYIKWKEEMPESRRFCPNRNCSMPIERNRGCNHFQCTMCKVHFCWLCKDFQAPNSQKIYRHLHEKHGSLGLNEEDIEEIRHWIMQEEEERYFGVLNAEQIRENFEELGFLGISVRPYAYIGPEQVPNPLAEFTDPVEAFLQHGHHYTKLRPYVG